MVVRQPWQAAERTTPTPCRRLPGQERPLLAPINFNMTAIGLVAVKMDTRTNTPSTTTTTYTIITITTTSTMAVAMVMAAILALTLPVRAPLLAVSAAAAAAAAVVVASTLITVLRMTAAAADLVAVHAITVVLCLHSHQCPMVAPMVRPCSHHSHRATALLGLHHRCQRLPLLQRPSLIGNHCVSKASAPMCALVSLLSRRQATTEALTASLIGWVTVTAGAHQVEARHHRRQAPHTLLAL